tara:strand:+ start:7415 stop:8893 length:1479 start_codon:yes stop_codon:yes gene_type:complete
MELSPVLQAFFQGQQGQTQQLQAVQNIQDRQAAAEERKAQLAEVVRQHNLENTRADRAYELQASADKAQRALQQFNVTKDLQGMLDSGALPLQTTDTPTNFAIPGMPSQVGPDMGIGSLPEIQGLPGINVQGGGLPTRTVDPFQMMNIPGFGEINVPQPQQTARDRAVEAEIAKFNATAPLKEASNIREFNATTGAEGEKNRTSRAANLENQLANQVEITGIRADAAMESANARVSAAEQRARFNAELKQIAEFQHLGIPAGDTIASHAAKMLPSFATGESDIKDVPTSIRGAYQKAAADNGIKLNVDKKKLDTFFRGPSRLAENNQLAETFQAAIKPNDRTMAGRATNWLSTLLGGGSGLNIDKSTYNAVAANGLIDFEVGKGLPLGSTRLKAMFDVVTSTNPLPGDAPEAIEMKKQLRADAVLNKMASDVSDLSANHRALLFAKLNVDNPSFVKGLDQDTAQRFLNATKTGDFIVGGRMRELIKRVQNAK